MQNLLEPRKLKKNNRRYFETEFIESISNETLCCFFGNLMFAFLIRDLYISKCELIQINKSMKYDQTMMDANNLVIV